MSAAPLRLPPAPAHPAPPRCSGVKGRPHGGVTSGFAAVEIAHRSDDPAAVCKRWADGIGEGATVDATNPTLLHLSGGQTMRFVVPDATGRTGVVGVDLWAVPSGGATAGGGTARKRFDSIEICGVRWTLVDPPPGPRL